MAKEKRHPVLPKIPAEMQQWVAALTAELDTWPKVTSKPMFGMTAYYAGKQIFAVLPKTRGFGAAKSIGIRVEDFSAETLARLMKDERAVNNHIGKKWVSFEVDSARDLRAALEWLSEAYEGNSRSPKAKGGKGSRKSSKGRKK